MDIDSCLNTPIKRIRNLQITSPNQIYEDHSNRKDIANCMIEKGYSKKLTNNVLQELNSRALEISNQIKSPPPNTSSKTPLSSSMKRFSRAHRNRFNQMESISNHYSVLFKEQDSKTPTIRNSNSNKNEMGKRSVSINGLNSETKRRRTLTEKDVLSLGQDSAKSKSQGERSSMNTSNKGIPTLKYRVPDIAPISKSPLISPTRGCNPVISSSPIRPLGENNFKIPKNIRDSIKDKENQSAKEGPKFATKISPSKRSFNLNKILTENNENDNSQNKSHLKATLTKSNIPTLKRSMVSSDKLGTERKASSEEKNNSKFQSMRPVSLSPTKFKKPDDIHTTKLQPHRKLASSTSLKSSYRSQQNLSNSTATRVDSNVENRKPINFTVPQPFALYERPTISSSQKSLQRFKKFKERFN